jgi:hypothetical protein
VCGTVPRLCFQYAPSDESLDEGKSFFKVAINEIKDLPRAIRNIHGNVEFPHRIFEIYPGDHSRSFDLCRARPQSKWVLQQLMVEMNERRKNGAYDFYQTIRATSDASTLRGRMWEGQVHKYFCSISDERTFYATSLDDHAKTICFSLSGGVDRKDFGTIQAFQGELASHIRDHKSCYLRPVSKTFATVDSVIFVPDCPQSEHPPVLFCQMADCLTHHINTSGLENIQRSFSRRIPELKSLRPAAGRKWAILFIVPKPTGSAFTEQNFSDAKGARIWGPKVAQYVLELDPVEVWRA